jgi:hypothetical protein
MKKYVDGYPGGTVRDIILKLHRLDKIGMRSVVCCAESRQASTC